MNKFTTIALLFTLISVAGAQVIPTFGSMDRDNSKDIDKEEAKKFFIVRSNFDKSDLDKDGYIDKDEYEQFRDKIVAAAHAKRDRVADWQRNNDRNNRRRR